MTISEVAVRVVAPTPTVKTGTAVRESAFGRFFVGAPAMGAFLPAQAAAHGRQPRATACAASFPLQYGHFCSGGAAAMLNSVVPARQR
jgi:hypothetical protein